MVWKDVPVHQIFGVSKDVGLYMGDPSQNFRQTKTHNTNNTRITSSMGITYL
jgi:hypothetical protein